jgi:hypothetical protein
MTARAQAKLGDNRPPGTATDTASAKPLATRISLEPMWP